MLAKQLDHLTERIVSLRIAPSPPLLPATGKVNEVADRLPHHGDADVVLPVLALGPASFVCITHRRTSVSPARKFCKLARGNCDAVPRYTAAAWGSSVAISSGGSSKSSTRAVKLEESKSTRRKSPSSGSLRLK